MKPWKLILIVAVFGLLIAIANVAVSVYIKHVPSIIISLGVCVAPIVLIVHAIKARNKRQ